MVKPLLVTGGSNQKLSPHQSLRLMLCFFNQIPTYNANNVVLIWIWMCAKCLFLMFVFSQLERLSSVSAWLVLGLIIVGLQHKLMSNNSVPDFVSLSNVMAVLIKAFRPWANFLLLRVGWFTHLKKNKGGKTSSALYKTFIRASLKAVCLPLQNKPKRLFLLQRLHVVGDDWRRPLSKMERS